MTHDEDARDEALDRVAEAVSDGTPVNWSRERVQRPELGPELEGLEVLAHVCESHGGAPVPAADPSVRDSQSAGAPAEDAPNDPSRQTTEEASPAPLFRWGTLQVLEKLGEGGFGEVYRAFDPHLQTEIALKLRKASADDAPAIETFLREARRLARVRHVNVLTVYGADVREGRVGIWTELIAGENLEQYLGRHGSLGPREAAGIGIDLCRALAAVHSAGLIHRDIKTGNIMRERGGRIVLMDFGSGGELPPEGDVHETDHIHGTPLFMAPEQLQGVIAGPRTDIYALGVVLYRLVTGRFPIAGTSLPEIVAKHRAGGTPLRDLRPDLPSGFVEVIHRALASDPAERYATAGAMELALAACLDGVRDPKPPPRPSRWRIAAVAVPVLVVAVIVLLKLWPRPAPPPTPPPAALQVEAALVRIVPGGDETLPAGSRIRPGDNLAMTVKGTARMYLYVLNEDTNGEVYVLYPLQGLSPVNPLPPGAPFRLPGHRGDSTFSWHVTSSGGRESVIALASREPLRDLEREIAGLPRAELGRPVRIQKDAVLRLRGIGGLAARPDSTPADTGAEDLTTALVNSLRGSGQIWLWHTVLQNP